MRFLKQNRHHLILYAKTAVIAGLFILVAIPFVRKVTYKEENVKPNEYYKVVLNGDPVGYIDNADIAQNAMGEARAILSQASRGVALVKADVELVSETDFNTRKVLTKEELSDAFCAKLSLDTEDSDEGKTAYMVRINDFTVNLGSIEEIKTLLNKVKDYYVDASDFSVEIDERSTGVYTAYKTNFISKDREIVEAAKILSKAKPSEEDTLTLNNTVAENDNTDDVEYKDGILSIEFAENIEILKTKCEKNDVKTIDEAFELVTKEHAARGTYTVQPGDCYSLIAKNYGLTIDELLAMNNGRTADSMIYAGDILTVTVPKSEISVRVVEEQSYEEDFAAPVQYVDNPKMYAGRQNVINPGSPGHRNVVALVTMVNGVPENKEIIKQTVTVEPVAQVIERGTLTPPKYIKPIRGGTINDRFGMRLHPILHQWILHSGVDWVVPTGTSVMAAASGTVVRASWYSAYGYCVDIRHVDGSMTRYAHLSRPLVAVGQQVVQGQTVALSGSTGNSTGPHLHFEIIIGGNFVNPVNYVGY